MFSFNKNTEYLIADKIAAIITPENKKSLTRLEIFPTLPSTNRFLLEQAKQNATSGYVCLTEEQTEGYGRRGSPWVAPPATNIFCSLLWRFSGSVNISGLSIAIGVILVNTLKKYGITSDLKLKWPNDLLVGSRKLAGILLETQGSAVVIGIGLNLRLPEDANPKWIALENMTSDIRRNFLTGLLINELLTELPVFQNQGLTPFLTEWQKHDALINQKIVIHTPMKKFPGVMRGISENGELLLEDEEGKKERFSYGEASLSH